MENRIVHFIAESHKIQKSTLIDANKFECIETLMSVYKIDFKKEVQLYQKTFTGVDVVEKFFAIIKRRLLGKRLYFAYCEQFMEERKLTEIEAKMENLFNASKPFAVSFMADKP